MDHATAKIWVYIAGSLMFCLLVVFRVLNMKVAMFITAGIWLVIHLVLMHFLRCKNCGRMPRRGFFSHDYCPYCGEHYE